jgi:N-terminal domain of ribose phosphate pyrophosphokinase
VREIAVFGGTAHPALTAEICASLSVPQQPVTLTRFANDCLEVQLQANCRERDVFIIQPLVPPVQENLVELLLMADAARGASAARVTAVMSHCAYARSDKKDKPRISIGGRLVADLLVTAGANRVLTLALHSPQVHGFFSVPVDHLHALRELAAQADADNPVNGFARFIYINTTVAPLNNIHWLASTWARPAAARPVPAESTSMSPWISRLSMSAWFTFRFTMIWLASCLALGSVAGFHCGLGTKISCLFSV